MIRFDFEERLEAFLISDRQWFRDHRIAHYKTQMKNAVTEEDKKFWSAAYTRVKKD